MASADDDAANGQARKKSTKVKMAPGEGLPANLYEKVKLAIYQSHGKSIIAATMQAKLDECHGPFQLQKFLIRWGGQFSKLAMFGVRLEMMATARSAADLTDHDPPEDPPENFGKDFKQAMMKHAAIARATREEHAARAQQLQEQWAAIMAVLDEEEAALDEGRAKRITNRRARSRTTASGQRAEVHRRRSARESRQQAGVSAAVSQWKRREAHNAESEEDRERCELFHCHARIDLCAVCPSVFLRTRSEPRALWRVLTAASVTSSAEARVRLLSTRRPAPPMSPEREQLRSKLQFEPRAALERPPSPERLGFQARPMPPRPDGASRGAQCTQLEVSVGCMDDRVG